MLNLLSRWQSTLATLTAVLIGTMLFAGCAVSTGKTTLLALVQDRSIDVFDTVLEELNETRTALVHFGAEPSIRSRTRVSDHVDSLRTRWAIFQAKFAHGVAADPSGVAALFDIDRGVAALRPQDLDIGRADATAGLLDLVGFLERRTATVVSIASGKLNDDLRTASASYDRALTFEFYLAALSLMCGIGLVASLIRSKVRANDLARRDVLTGLPNRLTFSQTLSTLIHKPGPGNEVALILLDVDLFKNVNDTLGHNAGDALLKEIARRLRMLPQNGIVVSRLGGDEFAIIIAVRSAYREASNMAGTIIECLKEPVFLEGKRITASMSIGIASTPSSWCDADTLLKNADIALYAAKAAGRGTFRFFDPRMDREIRARQDMEEDLREVVARDGLELHFQPIVDLRSKRVVRFEALARWNHPRLGYIPPLRFISVAEEIGLIATIGDWIIAEACRTALAWPHDVGVSINISSHQFDGTGLVTTLTKVLGETGIAPGRIELEITETVLLKDTDQVLSVMAALKGLGLRIALDDFGTGYSSLSYLCRFPIDKLKIDQSFIRETASKPEAATIVECIILLAHRLGLKTTAEGIETGQHLDLMQSVGCDEGQGYLFDKPLMAPACLERLQDQEFRLDAA